MVQKLTMTASMILVDLAETIRAIQIRVFTQQDHDPYRALYSRPGLPADD